MRDATASASILARTLIYMYKPRFSLDSLGDEGAIAGAQMLSLSYLTGLLTCPRERSYCIQSTQHSALSTRQHSRLFAKSWQSTQHSRLKIFHWLPALVSYECPMLDL
ncbi:MAG: hypothetical protein F6J93_34640 [Oscillatoria sp. SIO1A7]|nr:hypothetical protein [Oscillatoria sp. SIO1A7]